MVGSVNELCSILATSTLPWLPSNKWWSDFRANSATISDVLIDYWSPSRAPLRLACLLCLPFLEMRADHNISLKLGAAPKLMNLLIDGRSGEANLTDVFKGIRYADLSDEVRDYLLAWVRREFNVIGPEGR